MLLAVIKQDMRHPRRYGALCHELGALFPFIAGADAVAALMFSRVQRSIRSAQTFIDAAEGSIQHAHAQADGDGNGPLVGGGGGSGNRGSQAFGQLQPVMQLSLG